MESLLILWLLSRRQGRQIRPCACSQYVAGAGGSTAVSAAPAAERRLSPSLLPKCRSRLLSLPRPRVQARRWWRRQELCCSSCVHIQWQSPTHRSRAHSIATLSYQVTSDRPCACVHALLALPSMLDFASCPGSRQSGLGKTRRRKKALRHRWRQGGAGALL